MNILYAINSSNPGGAEQHVLDLIAGMVGLDHKVFVCCPEGKMAKIYEEVGAQITRMKIVADIDFAYITTLARFLRENKIDVLHAHELKAVGNALIAGFMAGTKVRVSHTHTPISEWQIPAWKRFANIRLFYSPIVNFLATKEIALTESRKKVKMKEGIAESKLEIIPNGVDLQRFFPLKKEHNAEAQFVFGYLGRLTIEKGIPVLLEAFAGLVSRAKIDPGAVKLVIAGGGELENQLKTRAHELKIENSIEFLGAFAEEEKTAIYSSFNALVFPSLAEGFGIVPVEAMAMQIPVIASDLEVLQEVCGSTAIFFEAGNADDLSEKMYNMYLKKDKIHTLGEEGRKRVEELFSNEKFVNTYNKLYEELLEAQK